MTLFVVAGWPRSGTSVMTHAAHVGGLPVVRDETSYPVARDGYRIQPNGFWQPPPRWWHSPALVAQADDHVVKFLVDTDPGPPVIGGILYDIALMVRNPIEVRRSLRAAYGRLSRYSPDRLGRWYDTMSDRADVAAIRMVDHRALVTDPEGTLASLGWPIQPKVAAGVVDAAWWRHRA